MAFMNEVDTGGSGSFMDNVDTGGAQQQTQSKPQVSEAAIASATSVANASKPRISQSAIDAVSAIFSGGSGGPLEDRPIDRTVLRFSEFSSTVKNLLLSPILSPLMEYGGVIFPNTPRISISYTSSYSPIELSHTNYDYQSYNKTSIQAISIDAKLTAQTLNEADYMLAVIHFLRTFSKMNYGVQDFERGSPPAILKLSAYGDHMIKDHPVAIRHFAIQLPDHVDYVQTSHKTQVPVYFEFNIDLVTMMTPLKVKNEFSLDAFASGNLITKGYL